MKLKKSPTDNLIKINKRELKNHILEICKEEHWQKILYAGIVGSFVATKRKNDMDVLCITSDTPERPSITHVGDISLLALNSSWLHYEKHLKDPTGLVPSVLFKSIELSKTIIGVKDDIDIPKIAACKADFVNIEIKKKRYEKIDRKNYLVALIFETLLQISSDLSLYNFDNIKMAKDIGFNDIAEELSLIYKKRKSV